jgi:DNA-binding NarL/FixJ family response regulator
MEMVRVLIYSDQPVMAIGFERLIADDPALDLTAYCRTLAELNDGLAGGNTDVAVIDLTPQITSSVLRELQHLAPECKLILWTSSIAADFALRALTIGIRGILRKTAPLNAYGQCLQRVQAGELWFERCVTDSFQHPNCVALSPREGQLVTLLARGLSNRGIASVLGIAEGTVKVYLSHLFQKCGTRGRFDMALYGLQNLNAPGISMDDEGNLLSLVMNR